MIMILSPTFLKNWSIPKYKKMVLIVNKMHYFKIISEDPWHPHLLPRVWKSECFFGYLAFSVPLIFHHCLEVLQILTCNVHSYPLSSKCSFVCHTYCATKSMFLRSTPRTHYTGIRTPISCMRSKVSHPRGKNSSKLEGDHYAEYRF